MKFLHNKGKYLRGGNRMIPKYQHIADDLAAQLGDRADRPEKLPTEKELCRRYRVSRQTVRRALLALEQEGLITRRQGSGIYPTGLGRERAKNQIALLLPSDQDYLYPRLLNDLQKPLLAAGFSVSLLLTEYSISREREILSSLLGAPPAGLLVDPIKNALPNPNLDLYEKLRSDGVATVFLQEPYDRFSVYPPAVRTDAFGGAGALVSLLLQKKCTGIAGVFLQDTKAGQERCFGYIRACIRAGFPWEESRVRWFSSRELLALRKKQDTGFLRDFIRENLGSCSAVIAQDDEIAYWLSKELEKTGRNVPEDVAVAGFDNSYLCDFATPGITSLAPEMRPGLAAAELLLAGLRGQKTADPTLSYTIMRRESC
jgi:GntR family transcriptional regulator of arabinose operon